MAADIEYKSIQNFKCSDLECLFLDKRILMCNAYILIG